MNKINQLKPCADAIIHGKRLHRNDDLAVFLSCDLEELCREADRIRAALCGNKVDLCTIINGKAGACSENCKFCAQSTFHQTSCKPHRFLDPEVILAEAQSNEQGGVDRFAIVTAQRRLDGNDFETALQTYRLLRRETRLDLCASMGLLTRKQLHRLHQAGVTSYHENIETSRRNFPNICTSHTYEDKLQTIRDAQAEGLCVCSGGIIGMGETWEDRLDMAISLAELGIQSIPINALMPIPGTPLEHLPPLTEEEILRTIAFFRFINPTANIRLAAGRGLLHHDGKQAFRSGASATITGDMLTTAGSTIASDRAMLQQMGRTVIDPSRRATGAATSCAAAR